MKNKKRVGGVSAKRILKKECEISLLVNSYAAPKLSYSGKDGERFSLALQSYIDATLFFSSTFKKKNKDLPVELRVYSATVEPKRNLGPNAMGKLRILKNIEARPDGPPPIHGFIDLPVAFFNSMEGQLRECAKAGAPFAVDLRCVATIDQVSKDYDGWKDAYPLQLEDLNISEQQEIEIIGFEFSSPGQQWQNTIGQAKTSLDGIAKRLAEVESTIAEKAKDELGRNGQITTTKSFKDQLARLERRLEQIKNDQESLRKSIEKKMSSVGDEFLNARREREILFDKISEPNDLMTKILMKLPIFRSLIRFISK